MPLDVLHTAAGRSCCRGISHFDQHLGWDYFVQKEGLEEGVGQLRLFLQQNASLFGVGDDKRLTRYQCEDSYLHLVTHLHLG